MREVEGKVVEIVSRPWQTIKLWSFKVEGDNKWYRMGKKEPEFKEGDTIWFKERNSNVEYDSIKAVKAGAKEAQPSSALDSTTKDTPPKSNTVEDVGRRLKYQAARADATRLVTAALQTDHLPHASNVAKGKRLGLLLGYIEEVTKTLIDQEDSNA